MAGQAGEGAADRLDDARSRLAAGEARAAFATLRWVFREPGLAANHPRLGAALELLEGIGRALAGDDFAGFVARARADLGDPQALYDLGYQLFEHRLFEVASCVLECASLAAPHQEAIVSEWVAALEEDGSNDRALAVLRAEPELLSGSFICRYLLAFNAVQAGKLDQARQAAAVLTPGDDEQHFMAGRIEAMLARAALVERLGGPGPRDLRGWHFVTTGGLLLHLSPHGFDDGMNGRYAYTQDSLDRCHLGLGRLRAALGAQGVRPARLLAPADRGSQILAGAAASLLGLPLSPLDDGPGLVVAYDLAALTPAELALLDPAREGQWVFSHATCWTDPPPFAPDLASYLHQVNVAPWGERLTAAGGQGGADRIPPDEAPAEELASRLLEAGPWEEELAPGDDEATLLAFCREVAPAVSLRGVGLRRSPLWGGGGPVKSSRFL